MNYTVEIKVTHRVDVEVDAANESEAIALAKIEFDENPEGRNDRDAYVEASSVFSVPDPAKPLARDTWHVVKDQLMRINRDGPSDYKPLVGGR